MTTAIAPRILKVADVAAYIRVHPMTIWRWAREGKFPKPVRLTQGRGGVTVWRVAEVDAWLAAQGL